jgi:hypothetical protein
LDRFLAIAEELKLKVLSTANPTENLQNLKELQPIFPVENPSESLGNVVVEHKP